MPINQLPHYNDFSQRGSKISVPPHERAESINILPNQTIILFNTNQTLSMLPDDCTPLVADTIRLINPLKSLS
jgi:hypothetical protein